MTKPASQKQSLPKVGPADDSKTLKVDGRPGEPMTDALAHAALRPTIQAAVTVRAYTQGTFGELSINTLMDDLGKQCALTSDGDLKRAEAILTAQAHTLDAIFNYLARRAQGAEYLSQLEIYLRIGLKAQSQCRATLETLAAIKNPAPVAFVRQANIAHGPQQVNNAPPLATTGAPRARESENPPNKLLEQQRNDWLDTRSDASDGRN
jgi:hypothetical protein